MAIDSLVLATHNDESSIRVEERQSFSAKKLWLRIYPLALIASFALLIFWQLPGTTRYDGDDYAQTDLIKLVPLPAVVTGYVDIANHRGYLAQVYGLVYEIFNRNLDAVIYSFVGLYVLSSVLLYFGLKRITSKPAATIGALLYLANGAKHHAVLTYNAQMYIVVVMAAMTIGLICMSGLPKLAKCALSTAIYWISLHLYEILIVLVPVFPALLIADCVKNRRKPRWDDLAYAFAPIAATLFHMTILSTRSTPIWIERNHMRQSDVIVRALSACIDASNRIFGLQHLEDTCRRLGSFVRYDFRADMSLALPLALAVVTLIAACAAMKATRAERLPSQRQYLPILMLMGTYIFLVGGATSAILSPNEVASRLLYFPTLGLSMLAAASFEFSRIYLRNVRFIDCVSVALLLCCFTEAVAFSDIVRQYIFTMRFDTDFTRQLQQLHPKTMRPGEQIFVSLPYDSGCSHYWADTVPDFVCGSSPIRLSKAYGLPIDAVPYSHYTRRKFEIVPDGLWHWFKTESRRNASSKLDVLYMDEQGTLHVVPCVTVMDIEGRFTQYGIGSWDEKSRKNALTLTINGF